MQYTLIHRETAAELARRNDPHEAPAYWAAWEAYVASVMQAGIVLFCSGLQGPDTAVTVRVRGSERQVHDGPFADAHEHISGYFVIEVDSLDEAVAWASLAPSSFAGSTEVRPGLLPRE